MINSELSPDLAVPLSFTERFSVPQLYFGFYFWIYDPQLYSLSSHLLSLLYPVTAGSYLWQHISDKPLVHYLLRTRQQTDKMND